MKVYQFGKKENPAIMLLPGTFCHWKNNFSGVIDLLTKDFFVLCISYDGFDETEETEFQDITVEVTKIEEYINKKLQGKIHAVYGCSLGGSLVGLMAKRGKIKMKHGILGSSDLDQASKISALVKTRIMILLLYKLLHKGKVPKLIKRQILKNGGEEYTKNALKMMGVDGVNMFFVTKASMKNQFYTDLVTKLNNSIEVSGTTIHCFYAAKMGEKYKYRYQKHFVKPHIVEHNLLHEELLLCHPKEWVENIKNCIL
ncbi:alpha/beta fold hydrolase [Clostridium felsineum]|uniref:Uncharacterized protein n=1 Tax=Clostridium felsineum TaxID=36839 RepID=A0A1S8MHK7_9CLOT|nr:alpha/beta fold hydrolase [Clostridium felsineum]URZ00302.1 hypothetical protein CLAUR_002900 [Clostridium felsineum]URZ07060.1 hypothetical protein CLROS_023930 [Clostridium felsineum]URZ12090.1 hypothetical protein CROST_028070 [Clostridium felsineum]